MSYIYKNSETWQSTIEQVARFILVFTIIFLASKFGQYLFFEWHTSPAVLWPPTGIGVAIMWLYGYRYALPIFLGLLASSLTGPTANYFPGVITTPMSQIAGQMFGVYLLKYFKFEGEFTNIRSVLVFFISIVLLAVISPTISTTISYLTGSLSGNYFVSFSRLWAGYAFSCLILTPFVMTWMLPDSYKEKSNLYETVLSGASLSIATYLLFWTRLPAQFGFVMFAIFLFAVVWVCLRLCPRIVTLSVVYITIVGILGLFLAPAPGQTLNSQLFASELFLFLVVPIMYAYSALVKERQKNLQELRLAFERIEMENANKTNFISVLAHELRNPLAPIKTTLEILKLQKFPPEITPLIVSAHNQVHVMRRLLDDLLDVTRVTQGKFQLKTETVQLVTLIHNVIEATKNTVSDYRHTLVVQPNPLDSVLLDVDPVRFEQVLVNVINNAAKFTDAGGEIKLSYSVKGKTLELRISDNGKGIEPHNLEPIFNSFWQIRDSYTTSDAGIGVGLALARQIIELHNGSIRAESNGLGQGSTFIISLPCVSAPLTVKKKNKQEVLLTGRYKILVVDDNRPAADALTQLLTMKGHTVVTGYSGGEGIKLVTAEVPEIVLLDIGLPDMSGYKVAEILREQGFKGALIALSGYGQQEDKQKALDSGFDFHFTKPMAIGNFEAYLRTAHV